VWAGEKADRDAGEARVTTSFRDRASSACQRDLQLEDRESRDDHDNAAPEDCGTRGLLRHHDRVLLGVMSYLLADPVVGD
jgi:hypothetical protein